MVRASDLHSEGHRFEPCTAHEIMFIVYVLKSQKNGKRYIGMTSKSINKRLDWHRWGLTSWTRQNRPFDLLYTEELQTKSDALKREQYLKTGQGRRTIDCLLKKR